jgi:hypothetical protein
MALGSAVLVASVIVLYRVGCARSESWVPLSSTEVYTYSSSQMMSASSSPRISESSHRDVTASSSYPSRRDMNSRAMHITVTPAVAGITANHRIQDPTAHNFYPSRHDWSKQAAEVDSNSNIPNTTQEYVVQLDHYPSRRERPQQKIEKIQVRLYKSTSNSIIRTYCSTGVPL